MKEALERIASALEVARRLAARYPPDRVKAASKSRGDPVTELDLALDRALREALLRPGEGWLSEETADSTARLACRRVWVVDPLDGTREFLDGLPEWCVSIGLVDGAEAVAGGILNPATGELYLGALGLGATLNGRPVRVSGGGTTVLASRTELKRGEWDRWKGAAFTIVPMGSVAYKLARVAAGQADATWTLTPKHEWDVAAGAALVLAAGGRVTLPDGSAPRFNSPDPLLPGLLAADVSRFPGLIAPRGSPGARRPPRP
jgi:myo-inositol-1(or 4)-monophosphatase